MPLLPISVAVFAILYGWTGYRGWLVFLIGLSGLWLLAALWVYSLERGITLRRSIHLGWASAGDSVPEQLEVANASRFAAPWLEIVDESSTLSEPLRLVSDVAARATRRRYPVHQFKKRGVYTLGPTRLRTSDPFGVYTLTRRDARTNTILITPPQLPLSQLHIAPGGWMGDRKRRPGALVREISDAGVREYVPGDSLRRIHWRASAHQDALIVRQMEAAAAEDWWIFVDLEAAVQAGEGDDSTLELSIVLAASIAMRGLRERRRVGVALAGPRLTWLEPRGDAAHRWRVLRALSMAEPGRVPLRELLSRGQPSHTASLIIITSTTDAGWPPTARQRYPRAAMTALLVNPADFGSARDQGSLGAALARARVPFVRMPGKLLRDAYLSSRQGGSVSPRPDPRKRYLETARSTWQSMD
jgi:uncharacterized protein (DUF58 family)